MTQAKDWSAAVDASLANDKGDLRATALATEGRNPDEFARARAVAQRHDWPVEAVADDPADFHAEDRLRRLDQLAAEQPKAAEFLRQPEHMALAGDDFDGMGLLARSIENLLPFGDRARKAVSRFALAPLRGLRRARIADSASVGTLSGLAATATTALDLADATNPNRVLGDLADAAAKHGDTAAAAALRARVDPLGIGAARDTTTAIANDAADESARLGAEVGGLPTGADWLRDPAAALEQATAHLGQGAALSAPLMAVGLATRDPALGAAALAVPTGGQTYVDMRRQGVDRIHSLVAGAGTAALEYTGEELAFESILLPSWRKALFAAPATEYGQEFVTQLGQEAVENVTTGQALDPWAMLQHANDAGLTGAFTGVAAAGGRAIVAAPLEYRARRRAAETTSVLGRIDASANAAIKLSELTEAAAKLRLGERAPDVAEAFVAHMGAGEEHVYIPAAEFRTLFQDGSASALADELTGQSNALALAGETGDLVIPLARYVSTVARLPNAPEISRVARMDADGYSRADLEGLDIAAELGALGETGDPAAASDGVEEIKQGVLAGLTATGRYKAADAELMASLFARMVGTMAARTGQDPRALYDRYRVRINGQATTRSTDGQAAGGLASEGGGAGQARVLAAGAAPDARGPGSEGSVAGDGGAQPVGAQGAGGQRTPNGSLGGLPRVRTPAGQLAGAHAVAQDAARAFAASRGFEYQPPAGYADGLRSNDPEAVARAERVASAFEAMAHDPQNPEVAAAYAAMIEETSAQFAAMLDAGLVVELIAPDEDGVIVDPYNGNPWGVHDDVRQHNHMWVFPTDAGFGTSDFDPVDNPLLAASTHVDANGRPMLANDVFRAVHDYFGHVMEGVGFRADGEENAWRAHAAMYSPLARRAMTTETRGQNSWLNFGPHGTENRTAKTEDTVFADQKIGLLPEWVSEEGRDDARTLNQGEQPRAPIDTPQFKAWFGDSKVVDADGKPLVVYHGTRTDFTEFKPNERNGGIFLTADPGTAATYAGPHDGARTMPVFVRAENPAYVAPDKYSFDAIQSAYSAGHDALITRDSDGRIGTIVAFEPTQIKSATANNGEFDPSNPSILFQPAQRNEIGLYSAVEQAVLDMPLPAWKKDGGTVKGSEVWAKLVKTPGVKAEELKWLGLEDWLRAGHVESSRDTIDDRFTREQVVAFVRENGVRVEPIVADEGDSEPVDAELNFERRADNDPSNWEYRAEDFVSEVEGDESVHWWDWDNWIEDNAEKVAAEFGLTDPEAEILDTRAALEEFVANRGGEFDYDKLFELARSDIERRADDVAEEEYKDNPVYIHETDEGITITGNEDVGFQVTGPNGQLIEDDMYTLDRARDAAYEWARENDIFGNSNADESKVAKWGEYLTPGRNDNYREIKLTLPDVPGSFVYSTHFDDENIVAFMRVTDRSMESGVDPDAPQDWKPRGFEFTVAELAARNADESLDADSRHAAGVLLVDYGRLYRKEQRLDAFFIEELQSDWHQKGRQKGYKDDAEIERTKTLLSEARANASVARAELGVAFVAAGFLDHLPEERRYVVQSGDPNYAIGLAIGAGMDADKIASSQAITDGMARWTAADKAEDQAIIESAKARAGVPDAPFKNDAWLSLAIKAAIVGAVEQGKTGFAWADSQTLVERWSESYRKLYETQYDTKMVSIVKKLTGVAPKHFILDGQPYPDTAALDAEYAETRAAMAERERTLEDRVRALPGFPSEATTQEQDAWVNSHPEAAGIQREAEAVRAAREALHDVDKPQGYWAIPLTDELRAQVERDAFPLFQKGEAAARGQLQIGADRSMAITLFEGADLSTFMHEAGHFWLEVMTDLAADPNAPQQVRDDFAAIQKYLGATGASGFTTEQHERWARSFEAYLREGKAPAPELIGAFARFRRWLTDLYRALGQLNVTLTPEITGVMDRMIAVDEEIELVRGQQSIVPIVEPGHAAALGLTDRQWETYAGMLEAAVEEARSEVTSKVLRAERQEHEQAWREEARTVRADIVAALERSPSYRAWRALTGRDETLPGLTLDRDALAARYTPEQMKGLRSLNTYRVEGGVDPDVAASLLGFDSGDALVQGLLAIRPAQAAISAEVEAEMHRRHPDPMDDGSLPDLVTRALYRSRRVAVLEHELGLLAKVAGQPAPNVRQLRAIADAVIARKTTRTLRPRDYLVAERKAAREATKAAAAGDFAAALIHKREQALQATLYGRARAAEERAEREVTALRRAASPATRERIGKAGKDYVEALDAMLEGHELRTVSGREVRRREALRAWVAAMQADDDETAVSDALLARVESEQVVNVADLPLPALTELHEAVKNLLHLARLKNTLVANGESRRWEEARAELLGRARQTLAEGKPLPFSDADRTRWQRLGDLYGDFMDWTLQPETVVEWLDGGEAGPWHDYLWTQSERAQAERERLRRMVGDALAAATAAHPNPKALDRRVLLRSLGRSVSRHTILAAALNLGNVSNTDKLMRGGFAVDGTQVPIDQSAIAEMLGHLTADDARLIQQVWDAVELLWPEIVKQQEALTGLAPAKVEARPLVIAGVAMRGGYYPAVYDPRASSAGVKQAQAQEDKLFAGGDFTKAVTSKGYIVGRTEYAAPILLDYHTVLTRHIGDVITDLSHRRFVKQALKVLGDNEIKGVIHQRLTSGAYHALLGSVRNAVVGGHRISEPASRGFEKIKRDTMTNTAVAALGFKVALTIGNLIGAPVQAAARVHARYLVAGFTRYMAHPLQMTQVIHELSPMMVGRAEGHDTSYEQVISQLRGKHGIRYKIAVVALACHRLIVPLVERPVWMGRYMQALAAKETPSEAARLADKAIRQTQTKNAPKDLSAVERDPRYTLFNMFIGPLIVINNRMQDAGLRGRLHGHVETPAEALGTWIAMIAGGSLLFELANGRGPDDEDDDGLGFADWAKWIALKAALLPLQTMPMIRNAANLFDGSASARPDPVTDAMASLVKFGKAAYESVDSYFEGGDVDAEKLTKATARATGVAVGVPSAQALTTGEFLYDVGTGAYTPQSPADARYLIYRRDK